MEPIVTFKFALKNCHWDWRDGSVMESTCCPSSRPELSSQHPCWVFNRGLQLQGILLCFLSAPPHFIHVDTYTDTHIKIN